MIPQTATAAELAQLLGVKQQVISELGGDGVMVRLERNEYDFKKSVLNYCDKLRQAATGRHKGETFANLTIQKARVAKEQADSYELKNAILRTEMVEAKLVQRQWADIMRRVRSAMLAVPSRVRHRLPHLTREDADEMDLEARLALTEASEMDVE